MVNSACGGLFTAEEGTFMSPNFPDPYSVSDECEWLIEVSPLNRVQLHFLEFEMPVAVNCSQGYVAIYDGNNSSARMLQKYCGAKPEQIINSTTNQMLVRLVSDGVNVAKGFKATYRLGCGRRLAVDDGGEIVSLRYPNRITSMEECDWILYASQIGEKVSLTVTHLNVHYHENCSFGAVLVYDGDQPDSPLIGQYCGHHLPPIIVSRGSVLHVRLLYGGVFRAIYGLLSQHCGGTLTSASGTFSSPGYPTNYDMEMECVWIIEASPGSTMRLSFESFNLESSEYCQSDYVEIRENDPSGRMIGKYCGNSIPSNITTAHKLWVKFSSDDIGTSPGFVAHYEIPHTNLINGTFGDIASPGYPHRFQHTSDFEWTVIVPIGMSVSAYFRDIAIATAGGDFSCASYVQMLDGIDEGAPELGKFCGYEVHDSIFTTGNVLTIRYHAAYFLPGTFYLHWAAFNESGARSSHDDSCFEEHILNATDVAVIQSPKFPDNYPYNYNCTYIVRTIPTHHLVVDFDVFELEPARLCTFDRLESYTVDNPNVDFWRLNTTLCNSDKFQLTSLNNALLLEFISDRVVSKKGFNATVKSECGGQLFGRSGVLRGSSVYPNIMNTSRYETLQCEWVITVKERRTMELTFENFDIESDSNCNNNYIMLRNGGHSTSPLLGNGKYCGSVKPELPETSSNQLYVLLNYRQAYGKSPVFDLRYGVKSTGCGGYLYLTADIPSVEISSPNYPSPPMHDASCEWVIVSQSGTRMRMDFDTPFQLSYPCYGEDHSEYLEIRDGGTENAQYLYRYCGSDEPSSIMSTGNALFVKFVSGVDDRGSGFKATIVTAHCGGTLSFYYAELQSPNYPQNYPAGIECEWFLKMRYGYYLQLLIEDFETPESSNCSNTDYLEIRDSDKDGEILGTYCGKPSELPIQIKLPSANAYVKFKSNPSVTAKGFSMRMHEDHDDGCGGNLEGNYGVITSPRYPDALAASRNCYWRIVAPPGRKIKLTFNALNLPYDENLNDCPSYVTVYNISNREQAYSGNGYQHKYCGSTIPEPIESSSSMLYVGAYVRGLSAGQGFSLTYDANEESQCGGILSPPSGIISTPNFTVQADTFVDCIWTSEIQGNQTLVLKFDYLYLPGNLTDYCRLSTLHVYGDSWYLGRFCGNISNSFIVTLPFFMSKFILMSSLDKQVGGFRAAYNVTNCGGVLDGSNADVTSPGYPTGYPTGMDCEWLLMVGYGETIQVVFHDLRLEADCSKDYLLIRNGRQLQSPVLAKLCGTQTVAPITASGDSVSVIFHSDNFGTAPGFRLSTTEMQRGCGGSIHFPRGNITSQNYPSRYGNNVECEWTFDYAPGSLVKLQFSGRFDLEMDSQCAKDYLRIDEMGSDGRWVTGERKCGSVAPPTYTSKTNKLKLTFHTNEGITADGFNLTYSLECGGNFTDPQGTLMSPHYPDHYPDSLYCTYTIGKSGDYITLQFDDLFSLEGIDGCYYDYVEIYHTNDSESNKQGRYCGDAPPAPRTLQGPVIVKFVTDYYYTARGFKMDYTIMSCGATLTSPTGMITTPSMTPGGSVDNMKCTWYLTGVANQVIQLRFLYFDLPSTYRCWTDYLEIYDGNSTTSSPSIGKFCGKGVNTVKSTGSELALKFKSSNSRTYRGFSAYYYRTYGEQQGCGGTLNATTGEIRSLDINSDGFYEPNLDCAWMILANDNDQIVKLEFQAFDLQDSRNQTCDTDFLEVRESAPDGPVLGRFCGNRNPPAMTTSASAVLVHFHSDEEINKSGFRLTFTVSPSPCGPSALLSQEEAQTLTSPGYPNAYPVGIRCKWTISRLYNYSASADTVIDVTITHLDIPCGGDYVEIKKRRDVHLESDNPVRACGTAPPKFQHYRGKVEVTFNSDAISNGGHGFNLTFINGGCNSTYTDGNGVIRNPGYPVRYQVARKCIMNITVPEGRTIAIYFKHFDIHSATDCVQSYMAIYDGRQITSPLLGKYCGNTLPNPVFSTGRSLTVDVTMKYRHGLYFFTYTSTDKGRGCGGELNGEEGSFSSPLYPRAYNATGECLWHVTVPGYHTVRLDITSFALNSAAGCDVNYLEIYEGSTDDIANRVARFCGSDTPGLHELNSNEAVVKLVTDSTNNQPGFYANFNMTSIVLENSVNVVQRFSNQRANTRD